MHLPNLHYEHFFLILPLRFFLLRCSQPQFLFHIPSLVGFHMYHRFISICKPDFLAYISLPIVLPYPIPTLLHVQAKFRSHDQPPVGGSGSSPRPILLRRPTQKLLPQFHCPSTSLRLSFWHGLASINTFFSLRPPSLFTLPFQYSLHIAHLLSVSSTPFPVLLSTPKPLPHSPFGTCWSRAKDLQFLFLLFNPTSFQP